MSKNLLISFATVLLLSATATPVFSFESGVQSISKPGEQPGEAPKVPAVQPANPVAPPAAAEQTYEEKAKALANKIKQGFMESSRLPAVTACIAKGTSAYAGFTSSDEANKAESITEKYLLMGKDEHLDLSNQQAVYDFLVKKLDERVGQNVQAGAEYFGAGWIQKAGACIRVAGNELYKYRLKQALTWAFTGQAKE
jgi:hypothetical protein